MINKGNLYGIVAGITPPFVFSALKKSSFYPKIVSFVNKPYNNFHSEEVVVTGGDLKGFSLILDPHGVWQPEMITGEYDHELFDYFHAYDFTDKTIYDIGAHIGYHSLVFSTYVGERGHVFAFEPNPVNATRLSEIVTLNTPVSKRITLLPLALSNTTGTTNFLSTSDLEGGSSTGGFISEASTLWERDRYISKIGFKETTVKLETIDNLVADKTLLPPDVLKIDVEGAEQLVLEGALKTISQFKPLIVVEFHSINSAFLCTSLLAKEGYSFEMLKKEPDGRVMIVAKPACNSI